MTSFNIRVAKTRLAELIAHAEAGEEITLTRGLSRSRGGRAASSDVLEGRARVGTKFFDPLPDGELRRWEER